MVINRLSLSLSLWQMLLGEFSYEEMEEKGNRVLAPIFFGLYMILVFFILVNMFVAIVTDAYAIVHEQSQSTTTIGTALRRTIKRNWAHNKTRFNRYFGSRKNLADALAGNVISAHHWCAALLAPVQLASLTRLRRAVPSTLRRCGSASICAIACRQRS